MNPYKISEPTTISFSGGRTSGYLLWRVLQENGGLPEGSHVLFANTGKEMPQTLDFIQACADNWGVDITWLEYGSRTLKPGMTIEDARPGVAAYDYTFNLVDYASASRCGEPFLRLMEDMNSMPNAMSRWCSGQLKVRTMKRYLESIGMDLPMPSFIGLRADEPRRAMKIHNTVNDGQELFCPLYLDGVTKGQVGEFWRAQPFDLGLPNNNGVTDWGNCDLCFLKANNKRTSIIRAQPELAQWWIDVEDKFDDRFDRMGRGYRDMVTIATDQPTFDFGDDESLPCFCGD